MNTNETEWGAGVGSPGGSQKASMPGLKPPPEEGQASWKIRGFTDAKMFVHPDRATLTFYLHGTVGSIHFDLARREIFFKGHNVKNRKLTREEWHWLQEFGRCLKDEGASTGLIEAYEKCIVENIPSS